MNNKGWGYSTMIICVCFILLLLLIVVYYVYIFYQGVEEDKEINKQNSYELYIKGMEESAIDYAKLYIDNLDDNLVVVIKLEQLVKLNMIEDYEDCTGYVNLKKVDDVYESEGYLKCSNYETEGYGE